MPEALWYNIVASSWLIKGCGIRNKVSWMVQGTFDWDRILDELIEVDDSRCDVCGSEIEIVHCKIVCRSCGNIRDCSDP